MRRKEKIIEQYIGEVSFNSCSTPMKLIEYRKRSDITIEFQDKHKTKMKTTYQNFKSGILSNPYDKTTYGVGCLGIGKYNTRINKVQTRSYNTWKNMIQRCYSKSQSQKYLAYYDECTVCDEWLNYQNFAKWYDENFYEVEGHRMHIDKDILVKDNKLYSPDTCIIIPQRINMVFMKKNRTKDSDLPNGINRCAGGFSSMYNGKSLGVYKSLDEALEIYNIKKRIHIKELAEEYKDKIPKKVYSALLCWQFG